MPPRFLIGVGVTVLIATTTSAQQPSARHSASMVYDPVRKVTLLFGGVTDSLGTDAYPNDLWAWNGIAWTRLTPSDGVRPPGRALAHFVFDEAQQRAMMFGGRRERLGSVEIEGDIWEWDGSRWSRITTDSASMLHGTPAYDPVRKRLVVFGGFSAGTISRQILEWNGTRWIVRDRDGPPTGPMSALAVGGAFDAAGHFTIVVMQSGSAGDSVATQSWTLADGNWTRREQGPAITSLQPFAAARDGTIYIYQTAGPRITRARLLVRSRDGRWHEYSPADQPTDRSGPASAFDPNRGVFLLFGGRVSGTRSLLGDLWEWDGQRWHQR